MQSHCMAHTETLVGFMVLMSGPLDTAWQRVDKWSWNSQSLQEAAPLMSFSLAQYEIHALVVISSVG
jgi:hypothetical protein